MCPIFLSTSVLNMVGQLVRLDCQKSTFGKELPKPFKDVSALSAAGRQTTSWQETGNITIPVSLVPTRLSVGSYTWRGWVEFYSPHAEPVCRARASTRLNTHHQVCPTLTHPCCHSFSHQRSCGTLNFHYIIVRKSEDSGLCYEYSMKCGNIKHYYTCSILRLKGKVMWLNGIKTTQYFQHIVKRKYFMWDLKQNTL